MVIKVKRNLYMPLIIVETYLLFTVLLYVYGPWNWKTENPLILYTLLILFQLALGLGYHQKIKSKLKVQVNKEFVEEKVKKSSITIYSMKFLKILIILNLFFIILNIFRTLNLSAFSFQILWEQLLLGFTDPATQYRESKTVTEKFGGSILSYANVLLAPLLWVSIPISLYRFKEFNFIYKTLIILMVFLEAARWISIGTNKGFIDLIIIFLTIYMVKKLSPFKKSNKKITIKNKKGKGWILVVTLVIFIGLTFFSQSINDRVQGNWNDLSTTLNYTEIDFDSPIMSVTPELFEPTIIYLGSYMTQGYYGLSLATSINWIPMLGLGNSMFLMENISPLINTDLFHLTYQKRLESSNWDSLVNWHSFYTWVANDFSFLGVVLLMYILGRFFASIIFNSVILGDNLALSILCLLIMLFIYIPANNQVMSYPTTFMAFWILTFIWFFKKKYKFVIK